MIKKGIGYSPLTENVYLGKQDKNKGVWVGPKEDITSDFIAVCMQWVGDNEIREIVGDKGSKNLIINCKKDKDSYERVIKYLQNKIKELE